MNQFFLLVYLFFVVSSMLHAMTCIHFIYFYGMLCLYIISEMMMLGKRSYVCVRSVRTRKKGEFVRVATFWAAKEERGTQRKERKKKVITQIFFFQLKWQINVKTFYFVLSFTFSSFCLPFLCTETRTTNDHYTLRLTLQFSNTYSRWWW